MHNASAMFLCSRGFCQVCTPPLAESCCTEGHNTQGLTSECENKECIIIMMMIICCCSRRICTVDPATGFQQGQQLLDGAQILGPRHTLLLLLHAKPGAHPASLFRRDNSWEKVSNVFTTVACSGWEWKCHSSSSEPDSRPPAQDLAETSRQSDLC